MQKTVLEIVQQYRRQQNLPVPTALATSTDPDELQLLSLVYGVCEELRRRGPFRQQVVKHEFDTVASTATYPLPGDFYAALPCTQYNQDTNWRLIGPLTDAEFEAYKEGAGATPTEYVWRIAGFDEATTSTSNRQLELYPTPAAAENLTFMYVTGHLFLPPIWTLSTAYSSGDYVNVNGRIYLCDTNGTSGTTPPSGTDNDQTDGTTRWDYFNSTYDTIQSDSDFCLFDHEIVRLGMRVKFLEATQEVAGGVVALRRQWERAMTSMGYRWDAQMRARGDRPNQFYSRHRPYVQPGSWTWS